MAEASPRILHDGWGYVEVEGLGRLRDAKLWPGGGRAWDWNETGTSHTPGIQPADVHELLAYEPDLIVLSSGRNSRLDVCQPTLDLLEQHGLTVERHPTAAAIERYNAAAEDRWVAALVHTTC